MAQLNYSCTEKQFIKEFIMSYKEHSLLWDKNNSNYKNRTLRDESYNILLQKCLKYYPEADVDFVKIKIKNIRNCFKREFKRVQSSSETESPYTSNLWYYHSLLFLEGHEEYQCSDSTSESSKIVDENQIQNYQVYPLLDQQKFLYDFIAVYKNNEVLWNTSHAHYRNKKERNKAYSNLLKKCHKYYPLASSYFVKNKISSIRTCFRREFLKVVNSKDHYKPTLWYYDSLLFLVGQEEDAHNESDDEINNGCLDPIDAFTEQKQFMIEFIALYKENKLLWNKNDPNYKNLNLRNAAYSVLKQKYSEYFPHVNEDFVRTKIDSMRASFRKEYKKVQSSLMTDRLYQPSLWYYDLLLFLVDQNEPCNQNFDDINSNTNKNISLKYIRPTCWTREHTIVLIDLFKKHPCLFEDKLYSRIEKLRSLKKVHHQLISKTGKYFKLNEIRTKLLALRRQYICETRKVQESKRTKDKELYKPTLWSYSLLRFLSKNENVTKVNNIYVKPRKKIINEREVHRDSDPSLHLPINKIEVINTDLDFEEIDNNIILNDNNSEDIYDTISKNVAHKLRDMSEKQRNIAQKILHDLMYYGQMEELSDDSYLCLRKPCGSNS